MILGYTVRSIRNVTIEGSIIEGESDHYKVIMITRLFFYFFHPSLNVMWLYQGLVKGVKLCLYPDFFGWLEK